MIKIRTIYNINNNQTKIKNNNKQLKIFHPLMEINLKIIIKT